MSFLFFILAACGGSKSGGGGGYGGSGYGGNGTGSTSSQPGILHVSLIDAPACGFEAVYVTVNKVMVNQSATAEEKDSGWSNLALNPAKKINLLSLTNGVMEDLGETPLAAGHYNQLRLVLDPNVGSTIANSVVLSGTTKEIPLVTPSSAQTGIKLINEFDMAAGQRVDLVLDFDACKSVVISGHNTYVAAKQTFGISPAVTVKSQAADMTTGTYNLALPFDAPLLGQYGTGSLPIVFTAQTSAAGQYNVEASAAGYATQSASKDISAGDAALDFILTP